MINSRGRRLFVFCLRRRRARTTTRPASTNSSRARSRALILSIYPSIWPTRSLARSLAFTPAQEESAYAQINLICALGHFQHSAARLFSLLSPLQLRRRPLPTHAAALHFSDTQFNSRYLRRAALKLLKVISFLN